MIGRLVAICSVISLILASLVFFLLGTVITDFESIGLVSAEVFVGMFVVCYLIIRPGATKTK